MYLENEIRACKIVLSESDGQIVAALEGLLKCTTATAVTNYLKAIPESVKTLANYREGIRARMEAMQAALDGEDGEDEEEATPEEEEPGE